MNYLKHYSPQVLFRFIVGELYARLWRAPILHSYSQNKEDIILEELLNNKKKGFYVDVGAYDPYRFSNTMRFYKHGWKGINIEPDIERWTKFLRIRRRDINLNIGIAPKKGSLIYYRMDPPTLSTFDERQAKKYQTQGFTLQEKKNVSVLPLVSVFKKYAKKIDFLTIDVEGMELAVLSSNDWKRYRPKFLCIETAHSDVDAFCVSIGYKKILDNGLNSFYKDIKK